MTRGRYLPSFVVIRWVILTLSWVQIQILPLCWQHDFEPRSLTWPPIFPMHIYIYMWILKGMALNGLKGIASNGLYSTCIDRYMNTCRRIFSYDHTTLYWPGPPMTGNKLMWFQSTNKSNVKCQIPSTAWISIQHQCQEKHVQSWDCKIQSSATITRATITRMPV